MFCVVLRLLFTDAEISNPVFTGVLETRGTIGVQKTAKNQKKRQTKAVFSEIVRTSKRVIFSKILIIYQTSLF